MAWAASTVCEHRTTGAATNGGGFGGGVGTAQLSPTDLVCAKASLTITSATGGFTAGMVGSTLNIASGTNFVPGQYTILSRTDTNTIAVDYSPCPAGAGSVGVGTVSAGIDYSQQDAAQLAIADVTVTQAAPTTLTSTGGGFTAAMVGNLVYLAGGTGGTVTTGWYQITAYTSGTVVTIDRTCAPSAATVTAVTCNVGGAAYILDATLDTFMENSVPGNGHWVKAGTYTLTAALSIAAAGTAALPIWIKGFNATRGDAPTGATRPLIAGGSNTLTLGSFWFVLYVYCTTTVSGGLALGGGSGAFYCRVVNSSSTTSRSGISGSWYIQVAFCEVVSTLGNAINFTSTNNNVRWCWLHDSSAGIAHTGNNGCTFLDCLIESCVTGNSATAPGMTTILGCTVVMSSDGVKHSSSSTDLIGQNNQIAYCTRGANWSGGTAQCSNYWDYNNWYGNGTDVTKVTKGPHDTASDPAFQGLRSWTDFVVSAGNNKIVTSVTGGLSTYYQAGDYIWFDAATGWTSGAYLINSVDSANQLTLNTSPAAVNVTGGIARTLRTSVGVSDCRLGEASNCRGAGIGLTLGVG